MIKKILKTISALAVAFGAESAMAAPCDGLSISSQPALVNFPAEQGAMQTINVTRTSNSGSCNFWIFIQNNATTYTNRVLTKGGKTVGIQFYSQPGQVAGNIIRSNSEATQSSHSLSGALGNGVTSLNVYYYAYVDLAANVTAGPYVERFYFQLYSGNFNSRSQVNTNASTNYKYTVDDTMSLSLVPRGSSYDALSTAQTLNFGSLTSGETLGCDLWLVYSNGYKLSLISTNSGNLKNTAVASNNLVPYSLTLDGSPVTLSNVETVVKQGTGASLSGGTKILVDAVIGNVGSAYSGTYNDYVTFKVAAP